MDKDKIIQELIDISKVKGYIAVKQIMKYVSDDTEEFDLIVAELEKKQVDVVSADDMINLQMPEVEELDEDDDDSILALDPSIVLDLDFTRDIEKELLHDKSFENQISIKVDDPVRMYLKEIGRVDLLVGSMEVELAIDIANAKVAKEQFEEMVEMGEDIDPEYKKQVEELMYKGELAKNKLVEANLRLVVSIAKRYVGRGMQFLDLIQEGNMGLMKAVGKFDHTKGFKFSTYATWWIRQAITRAIADQARTIRIPVHMVETINKLVRTQRQLIQELKREPRPEEVAERMGITVEKVQIIQKVAQEPISLESPVGEEEDSSLGDFIPDYNIYTDGACINNGKTNAKAAIGIYFGKNDSRNVSEKLSDDEKQSNNTAELQAIIKTYDIIKQDIQAGKKIVIYSDSVYAIRAATTYGEKVSKIDYKDIINKELIKQIYTLYLNKKNIKFRYIEAHTDKKDIHSRGNKEADELANQALENCSSNDLEVNKKIYANVPFANSNIFYYKKGLHLLFWRT